MKDINGAAFRSNQAQHLDECEASGVPLRITTQKRGRKDVYQRMIVMSEVEYIKLKGDK